MLVIKTHEEFESHLHKEPVISPWHIITLEQIRGFTKVTLGQSVPEVCIGSEAGEHPGIPAAAPAYFTISLIPFFWQQMVAIQNLSMQVNYGIEKLEFGDTVVAGNEIRCHGALKGIANLRGITKATFAIQLEIRGHSIPAFTADIVFLCHFN